LHTPAALACLNTQFETIVVESDIQ
jgi:hypothetical protein